MMVAAFALDKVFLMPEAELRLAKDEMGKDRTGEVVGGPEILVLAEVKEGTVIKIGGDKGAVEIIKMLLIL